MTRPIFAFTILFLLPMFSLAQVNGLRDSLGRKQGEHREYSGSITFIRTYRNDTLNGNFRQYTSDKSLSTDGYFKNGLRDSVWIDYYPDKTVKRQEFYVTGKKNGTFIEYHPNGQPAYTGTFKNGVPAGDEIRYYDNGAIRSKGNAQNGLWTEYYINGRPKTVATFVDRKLSGQRFYFTPQGDTLLPGPVKPLPVTDDTSVVNHTDLRVYCLFDSEDSIHRPIDFDVYLFSPIGVCINKSVTINTGNIHFLVKPDGLWMYEKSGNACTQTIKTNGYTTSRTVTELPNGKYDIKYLTEKKYFPSRFGKIEVERQALQCDDTGSNPVKIMKDGKTLYFKNIGNLSFFEYDCNNDGKTELYILNYFSCMGRLKIYKIDDQ